jgi:predicted RNA-binding Zn-ribbon protein involved in translation (DUF1610 family)
MPTPDQGLLLNFEQVQFVCPECHIPGIIRDVFVSATTVLLRGRCTKCGYADGLDAIDLLAVANALETQRSRVKKGCFQRRLVGVLSDEF